MVGEHRGPGACHTPARGATMARFGRVVPPLLVLAGFFLHFAGTRWGAYVATPVPGLYLADLLWVLGCVTAALSWRRVKALNRSVVLAAVACTAYLILKFALSVSSVDSVYLAVRDLAPFAYLALVPLAAVALANASERQFLWTLRAGSLTLAIVSFSVMAGLSLSGVGERLGGEKLAGMDFLSRGDAAGAVLGIGVIAWGAFPGLARPGRVAQVALLAAGFSIGSRAGALSLLVCIVWAVIRECRIASWKWLGWAAVGLTVSAVLAVVAVPALRQVGSDASSTVTVESPIATDTAEGGTTETATGGTTEAAEGGPSTGLSRLTGESLSEGTASARVDTYRHVIAFLSSDGRWVFGTGFGRADTLLSACGFTLEEYVANSARNRCAVDNGWDPLPLRDPHNGVLNLVLYNGVFGLALFLAALLAYWRPAPREPVVSLAVIPVLAYLLTGMFGVIWSSPFGMLPIATFTAFALSRRLVDGPVSKGPEALSPLEAASL